MAPVILFLVRHGESTWNVEKRWQGQADPPLSELGVAQARSAVLRMPTGFEQVVTSDLARARNTAELLAAGLGLPLVVDERVRERYAGPWEGLTRDEIETRWPGMLADGRRPDDYEADEPLLERVLAALDPIEPPTIVVTHGGVIRVIERHLGAPLGRIPNLSALMLTREGTDFVAGQRFDLCGDGDVALEAGG